MTIETAIKILTAHNRWRRGAKIKMICPKKSGEAIDIILNLLRLAMKKYRKLKNGK